MRRGARRAVHGRPLGPRARAPRSTRRPCPVQRRASAPRPPAPLLRRTRVLLPGPLSHAWWGCQGTRGPRPPPHNRGARPTYRPAGPPRVGDGGHRVPGLKRSWQGPALKRSLGDQRGGYPDRWTARRACRAQPDLSRSVLCHDLLRSGRISQSRGAPGAGKHRRTMVILPGRRVARLTARRSPGYAVVYPSRRAAPARRAGAWRCSRRALWAGGRAWGCPGDG